MSFICKHYVGVVYLYFFVWYTHIFVVVTYLKLHCIFECVKVMINIFIILHMYCVYDHYHSL